MKGAFFSTGVLTGSPMPYNLNSVSLARASLYVISLVNVVEYYLCM